MVDIRQIDPDAPRWTRLTAQLLLDEGRRLKIYADTAKPPKLTGGVGHNFSDRPVPGIKPYVGMVLTSRQIDDLYYIDRREAIFGVSTRIPFAMALAPARFDALANMAYNLGIGGLLKFKHLLAAMERGDWPGAVRELDDSIWSHQVDDGIGGRIGRADRIAQLIITGLYPDER
jgi:lysozyme